MCDQQTVLRVPVAMERNASWRKTLLLQADVHWDNPLCRRDLFKRHLDQAVERDADVFVIGDFFCAMGGKYDPRGTKSKLRAEHNVDNYFDALVDTAADYLAPYASRLRLLSRGNHETAVMKRQETDLTGRLCDALGRRHGSPVEAGSYAGWTLLQLRDGPFSQTVTLRWHHGHGGGGIVTKGTLHPQRRAAWWPDADIVVSGHIHEQWSFPITRERLSKAGKVYQDTQLHLQLPTYKDETSIGGGWAIEKGMPPKPLGAWWVHLTYDGATRRIVYSEERAQ